MTFLTCARCTGQVSLNRPTKLNALNMGMFRAILKATKELQVVALTPPHRTSTPLHGLGTHTRASLPPHFARAHLRLLQQDRDVAAVILRGEGRAFCAGLDFKNVLSDPLSFKTNFHELMDREPGGSAANLVQAVGYNWKKVPAPVICVTHGVCFGGGLQIALGADFRYTAPDCQFSIMESKWGLVPDMSASVTLRELVPIDVAKELTMTHRIFKGAEAKELGLVTRVCEDPMAEALALAKDIASKSPDAVAAAKRLYNKTYALNDREALELESELQTKLILGWNNVASVAKGFGVPDFLAPKKSKRNEYWHQDQ